ncbi:integrase, partial [Salinicola sp. MH3R3-1]
MVCSAFDIARSSYYEHRHQRSRIDVERLALRATVAELFNQSRRSAGSRTIMLQMREAGLNMGRFKIR